MITYVNALVVRTNPYIPFSVVYDGRDKFVGYLFFSGKGKPFFGIRIITTYSFGMGDIKPKLGKGVYVHSLFPSEGQDNLHFLAKALRSPVDVINVAV